ncbi:hypothetical protein P3X46_029635 [Hevea brasiliensis]|uniref:Pollen Ole e 1 allergen and extensin family protein n=1 Tax=Hevea brasiliensis TaxID=3981 RepID=A0ABQ9KSU2_HEVBR|nr:vegetative cell wall protein gp1 [Hevea brasiliensis]KAJ9147478.1 hypothetical protein P3X46_029635 [Hevea brasiliensis]
MPSFFIIFLLCFTFINNLSEASHDRKLPSAVVVGTVYCDTCFREDFSKNSHFISGASVAVECTDENSKSNFRKEVKTDEHGEFKVHLPFSVSKHVKRIKRCSVKLLSSSEPYCAVASTATSSSLRLKSRKEGLHIFSAGFFSFKPQKQPNLCNQKPSIQNSRELNAQKSSIPSIPPSDSPAFPPPLQDPTVPDLPPVNQNPSVPLLPNLPPLPKLPPFPPIPGLPYLPPVPGKTSTNTKAYTESLKSAQASDQKEVSPNFFFPTPPLFPPNPFQPPPLLPNPLQPPPLIPPLLPPNPLQPPPAPLIPLPPIPGLTPPSPPPPIIPFLPFPPFPFPPSPPRIPGIPPASSSTPQKTSP